MTQPKVDFKKILPGYQASVGCPALITTAPTRYFVIDGSGDPNTAEDYQQALQALYPVAYALKFASKDRGQDYVVPPLEGLWWAEDMDSFTRLRDKSKWQWSMMLLIPSWMTDADAQAAIQRVALKSSPPEAVHRVRVMELDEGQCVQALHLGPYDDEGPLLEHMHHEFIPQHGLELTGRHHEIYLSDPRRAAPEKLRTILRQPVRRST
ncbi:GyrI-like domain-containing protein [Glutamicibacter endophyticus]